MEKRLDIDFSIAKEENITVSSRFDIWLKEYKQNSVKASTYETYKRIFKGLVAPVLGNKKLKDIRPEMVQKLINDLYKKGYSKTRVNIPYILLLGMYKQAIKNGLVKNNPAEHINFPKYKTRIERRVLDLEEQKIFMQYAKESRYYDFYAIALNTGMRCNEIIALQWTDINFKGKIISVSGTLVYVRSVRKRFKDTPKTSSSYRDIPIHEQTENLLKLIRKNQMECKLMMGDKWQQDKGLDNLIFTNEFGKAVWDTCIRNDINRISKQSFRHTFATRGLENGIKPKVMQTILGHSTLAMTMDLYSHVLPDEKTKEMEKMPAIF